MALWARSSALLSLARPTRGGLSGSLNRYPIIAQSLVKRSHQTDSTESRYQSITSNLKDITQSAREEAKSNLGTVVSAVSGLKGATDPSNPSQEVNPARNAAENPAQSSAIASNWVCTTTYLLSSQYLSGSASI
jgi:hypothetical protein